MGEDLGMSHERDGGREDDGADQREHGDQRHGPVDHLRYDTLSEQEPDEREHREGQRPFTYIPIALC
jgi:hypothetical protein